MKASKTLRVAVWEVMRNAGEIRLRTVLVAGIAAVVVVGSAPLFMDKGVDIEDGIYRVGVSQDSPYYEAVDSSGSLDSREPSMEALESGGIDVLVLNGSVSSVDSRKGRAAVAGLRSAVQRYNNRLMRMEDDQAAAFPVEVDLMYLEQDAALVGAGTGTGSGGGVGGDGSAGESGARGASDDTGGSGAASGLGGVFGGGDPNTPGGITPPFPFESLLLAFLFILPLNFVIQAYSSSVINERINRRGELLLVSPVSRYDIIAGKSIPYLAVMVLVSVVIAIGIGGGFVSVVAVVPVALVYLATAFVGAMFARSYKELTFVTVSISVLLTAYVFVPAIFTDVHPIAAISPITLVVRELEGAVVGVGDYLFSTLPLYLTSAVLFMLGAGVYREEDMFSQRPVPLKALDAVSSQIKRRVSVAKLSVLFIPFVFAMELLTLATLFALPFQVSLPILLLAIALIEELAKSVQVYAGFVHSIFERSTRNALVLGGLSGAGFFLGEKLTLLTQIVGIPNLELGRAAFGLNTLSPASPLILLSLLFAPLVLHVVTASLSAVGARYGRNEYILGLTVAVVLHAAYNYGVVVLVG